MSTVARWWRPLVFGAWSWIAFVLAVTFWKAWDIPTRLPEINELATAHLFLFPVSLLLFLALSWVRKQRDEAEPTAEPKIASMPRWRATIGIWVLAFLHPVSCGLYPAVFNFDDRTVKEITRAVSEMRVGMTRAEAARQILALNASLPVSMDTDRAKHEFHQRLVARYLATADRTERERLGNELSRAILVFVAMAPDGKPLEPNAPEEFFQRRVRAKSDIGEDRIRIRYDPSGGLQEVVYSSNRQLTETRGACTIHMIVPAPPESSFPYPCTS
jgi:hypothetical protein